MRTPLESMYSRIKITPTWNKNEWVLLEEFIYYIWSKWFKDCIVIPEWFVFNGASIPKVFHIIWTPMAQDTLIASLVHDFLYSIQKTTRSYADDVFNSIMLLCDVRPLKRIVYYIWVRLWGWVAWRKK
jgi:hypothetical protein